MINAMLPLSLISFFGAVACASAGIIVDEKLNVDADDDRTAIFAQAPSAKSIIHRSLPYYYVSYDLFENTCTNERCNDVADLFLKSVKKSINPCDNFYAYACGQVPSEMSSVTKEMQEILEESSFEKEEMKSLALEKKLYRSCMEQQDYEHKTRRELGKLLSLSNGLRLFRSTAGHEFGLGDWQAIDGLYASLGFEHAFFHVHVMRDPQNSDVNLIALNPPSPMYFFSIHGFLKYKNLTGIMTKLLEDYAPNDSPYVTDYEDVVKFNNAIHEILPPLGMFEENITTLINNKMTVSEWQIIYDSIIESQGFDVDSERTHINWLKLLNSFLKTANVHIDEFENIIVKKIDYFTKLARLLQKTSPATIEKYIHFKFLTQISKYLGPSLARSFENILDRPTFCIQQSDNMLIGATYEYIKRHVPEEQKIYAVKVIENVRKSLKHLLSNADWMDRETKSYARNKLENLEMIVGYPDWQANRTFVNHYYGNLHLKSNFFENVVNYKRKLLVHELRGLRQQRAYDPTTMSKKLVPLIYYFEVNSHMNRIIFPTEYLNEKKYKLFSTNLPSAINYGSFGSMLGSILYDYVSLTDNLKYNQFYSRTALGLSKDTINAYKVKEKCLSSQLGNYKKSSPKLNQPLASIIDRDTIQVDKIYEKITGLRAAFEAYIKNEIDDEELLPGFKEMSSSQLFFLSYAERICEVGDIYDRFDTYETSLRVNGVVSNLEVFSDVFLCQWYNPMNRETKCELFS